LPEVPEEEEEANSDEPDWHFNMRKRRKESPHLRMAEWP